MNIFQRRALELFAALGDEFHCLERLYIFESVARGETATSNDLDICVEYVETGQHSDRFTDSYTKFQGTCEDWAEATSQLLGDQFAFTTSISPTARMTRGLQF